ncbi:hypothetical protein ASPZODRAFT_76256 [Penicilliopsis zonata CBS 506.65]|uniref:Zn(2)-C6 fungal-type domain-containing protein n=1 Tax=Penicilliopsis zonata CBS 506.65 TaxID=1073090 RepID=A0A1L9S658_9EURO|nr:hypothetical protein ASPZODRAFT_76256 [Penicilliopsis zonata CBS 506.65]OJJ42652.1 hypothetical protein ASPZODRAFT_76256 [Penicilliopsis zonata CBS 506.65]
MARLPIRRPRLKVSKACQECRSRKTKCDGNRPACARCQTGGKTCNYSRSSGVSAPRQAPEHVPVLASPPSSHETSPTPATIGICSFPGPSGADRGLDPDQSQSRAYYAAHGQFAGQVAAAIDERAGLVPLVTSYLVPLVDAPLFGDLDLPIRCSPLSISTELPCRTHADHLVDVYWQYIDPAEPILDRQQFAQYYTASFASPSVSHVQLGILNLVFALAVQRQESTPLEQRNEEGNTYFHRAWALLPAEAILWEPASLERVQCLMLMNRYLHCTKNQQKTWMTAGLAMRIAQTMCCHTLGTPSTEDVSEDARIKRKVWASCVALDRCISWSLGKRSALALISSPTNSSRQEGQRTEHSRWESELQEIGNQIQLAQIQTGSTLAARSVTRLDQQEEYHTAVVRMDACLDKWEASLPSHFQLQNLRFLQDTTSQMERYLLHLRLLHSRIYLYRPLLARFYSMKSDPESKSITCASLSERLLRECARMCVTAAQGVTSLVVETLEDPGQGIGILPWWTRIYYLHISGVVFLAAMVGSDLFTDSVSQSWQYVLMALRAHVHLSTYVQQCVWTFEALAAKISQTNCLPLQDGGRSLADGAGCCFDDIFQDMRFDFDDFLFRTEEVVNFDGLG